MKPLIITRPEPGLSASMEAARELGLTPIAAPLFSVLPVEWDMPPDCDSVLIGSANVLRHGGDKLASLKGLPVYAVGEKTAEAAQEAGLDVVFTGEDGLESCVNTLVKDGKTRPLRLTGVTHTELKPRANLHISTAICYDTKLLSLAEEAIKAMANPAIIMAYSGAAVSAIEAEMARLDIPAKSHDLLAISPRAADYASAPWRQITIADSPDDAAMLAQAQILCHRGQD